MKRIFAFFVTCCITIAAVAEVPLSYYSNTNGKKKSDLKAALFSIIQPKKTLTYGSGAGHTWQGFYSTDRMPNGEVRDRYSNDHRYFSQTSPYAAVSGMNIEHSFPKSWWGGTTNNAYRDLFNLMPCEAKINNSKSNYAMGVVTSVSTDNGCTKVGKGTTKPGTTKSLWEPADKWKGDFARAYMYMATTYSNLTWEGEGLTMLENNNWPTLQPWAYTLLLQWNSDDPVDEIEIDRNEAVFGIQGNRNPFVDFPHLAEYIWGDSVNVAFNPTTSYKAGQIEVPDVPDVDDDDTLQSIDELLANCTGTSESTGAKVDFKFEDLLVNYTNGKYVYVTDGSKGYLFFGSQTKVKTGDRISGTVAGTNYYYKGLPELGFSDAFANVTVTSSGNTTPALPATIGAINAEGGSGLFSMLVSLRGVSPKASSFTGQTLNFVDASGHTLQVYDKWKLITSATLSTTKQYEIIGIPCIFDDVPQLYPLSIRELVSGDLDGNDHLDMNDLEILKRMITTLSAYDSQADLTGNGKITIADLTQLIRLLQK